jgi:hypothetical protein
MADPVHAAPPEQTPDSTEFVLPRRRVWPVLLVVFALLGVGAFFVVRELRAPLPLRVLIAIDLDGYPWEGSAPAALLVDRLAERLGELGFDPVRAGDPENLKILEKEKDPLVAAAKLHAAFVISGKIAPVIEEHPVEGGFFEARAVKVPIEVRCVLDDKGTPLELNGFAGSKKREDAVKLLAQNMADMTFDVVLPALTGHRSIASLFEGTGDPTLANKVGPARDYVADRKRRLADAADGYAKLAKTHLEGEKGPLPVTYLGAFDATDGIAGVGDKGVLVQTADVKPWYWHKDLGWISTLETLEWRSSKGEKTVLWSGYHLLGYAAVAPEGAPAVVIEDLFGWAKAITVVDNKGASHRVRVDPKHRFIEPKVAPGGRFVAVYDRDCYRCPAGFLVLNLESGKDLFKIDPDQGGISGYAWLDSHRVVFLRPPEPEKPIAFFVVDVAEADPSISILWKGKAGELYSDPSVSADGSKIAVALVESRGDGSASRSVDEAGETLGVFDVNAKTMNRFAVAGGLANPAIDRAGTKVAAIVWGAEIFAGEIGLYDLGSQKLDVLTKNQFEEKNPRFTADEKAIIFESRSQDPVFPSRRIVSTLASVPVK